MSKAARAIVIENDKILVMHRNKEGNQYYTLVGGLVNDDEDTEAALKREVKEETGLEITESRLVFIEKHPAPYNEQYIYLCRIAPHESIGIQVGSEEAIMNRVNINVHKPLWASLSSFPSIAFSTPQLQKAILEGIEKGFPEEPIIL